MQSDAFPTPPVYGYLFQPSLLQPFSGFEHDPEVAIEINSGNHASDRHLKKLLSHDHSHGLNALLTDIEALIINCSNEEAQLFWSAADHLKSKYQQCSA
jgi:hypothetical protein